MKRDRKTPNSILEKYWPVLIYLFVSLIFLFPNLRQDGIPFKYDWSWPIFDLSQFWNGLTDSGMQGIFTVLSKNGPAILGLFGLINFPSQLLLKLFLFLVHFTAGYGFYRFIRNRVSSEVIAIISGLAYAFSSYIFIRTIVGFTWSLAAYALVPIFLSIYWHETKKITDYVLAGFLLSLIFCQVQAGVLITLIISIHLVIKLFTRERIIVTKSYFSTFAMLAAVSLPWAIVLLARKQSAAVASGGAVTTLNFIASLPHSFRNMFMLSDHHITVEYFYPLSHNRIYLLGWLVVWLVALCAIFNRKNRTLVLVLIISSLLVLPFTKGPVGLFGNFYVWFYHHIPQVAIFRETYHLDFLYAISLCILFALGLDWAWQKINSLNISVLSTQYSVLVKTNLKAVFALSAIVIIYPYLTFDYAGYLKPQKIPTEYKDMRSYLHEAQSCHKIYYPPGLGFVYFKGDSSKGASNSDVLAGAMGIPFLADGSSVLNMPTAETYYRNRVISQFYESLDDGRFTSLLAEGGVDCVVIRTDLASKYSQASNLSQEVDSNIVSKWENSDLLGQARSKQGLVLEKQFGDSLYVYKASPVATANVDSKSEMAKNIDVSVTEKFSNRQTLQLPLTEWAVEFSYYKDGWSRGRYDFWRKHLFAQLEQDFIYTDKTDSILTGEMTATGRYEIWIRHLAGGKTGVIGLKLKNYDYKIIKDQGEERFVWKKLGDVEVKTGEIIEIENVAGENAIADVVLVRSN